MGKYMPYFIYINGLSCVLGFTLYRYPSKYIDTYVQEFFNELLPISSFLPLINDENQFLMLRKKLFAQPSVKEIQTRRQIANIETHGDDQRNKKFEKTLFLHYTHEHRLDSLKRDIHQIYTEVFQGITASHSRLIIGHRNSRNTQLELVQKRPHSGFVKLKTVKSMGFLPYIKKTSTGESILCFKNKRIKDQQFIKYNLINPTKHTNKTFRHYSYPRH